MHRWFGRFPIGNLTTGKAQIATKKPQHTSRLALTGNLCFHRKQEPPKKTGHARNMSFKIAFAASDIEVAQQARAALIGLYGQADEAAADVIVALGGDGFMLHTLHRTQALQVPVYGMNRGTVGFLMNEYNADNGGGGFLLDVEGETWLLPDDCKWSGRGKLSYS